MNEQQPVNFGEQAEWGVGELAEYDQLLRKEGHLVFIQEYRKIGASFEPINQGQIPDDYVAFSLLPRRGEETTATLLVLDPKRVEFKIVELEKGKASLEGRAERDEKRQSLQDEGYPLVVHQFEETVECGVRVTNLIALRTKIPEVFYK